ncbi:MAG: hypothetical protein ACYC8T_07755 [Myxococcaceae bacterium]
MSGFADLANPSAHSAKGDRGTQLISVAADNSLEVLTFPYREGIELMKIPKSELRKSFQEAAKTIRAADKNHDGRVTQAELTRALVDKSGEEQLFTTSFYRFAKALPAKEGEVRKPGVQVNGLSSAVNKAMTTLVNPLDTNGDQFITTKEAKQFGGKELVFEAMDDARGRIAEKAKADRRQHVTGGR